MESLSVLRLSSPLNSPRRHPPQFYTEDCGSSYSTPYASAPSSPRAFRKEVQEAPLGEVRAAIPFVWEKAPGTPRDSSEEKEVREDEEDGSASGSAGPSRESSISEFEFSARFTTVVDTSAENAETMSTADELFFKGQILPLRLPPRLHAVKHMLASDSTSSDDSSSGSFNLGSVAASSASSAPQSPRSSISQNPAGKIRALFGLSNPGESKGILGMEERSSRADRGGQRRSRSLSPLRMLRRGIPETEREGDNFSFAESSAVEKSGDGPKDFWPNFKEKRFQRRTLKDLLLAAREAPNSTDKSPRSHDSTERPKSLPRISESGTGLVKNVDTEVATALPSGRKGSLPRFFSRFSKSSRSRAAVSSQVDSVGTMEEQSGRSVLPHKMDLLIVGCMGLPPLKRYEKYAGLYVSP